MASETLTGLIKAVASLRRSVGIAGISGVGALVGFSIALYACHAEWSPEKLLRTMLCIASFTFIMVLLQQGETWMKGHDGGSRG